MVHGGSIGAAVLFAGLLWVGAAAVADEAKYPNWKGQWDVISPRFGGQTLKFDPTKKFGPDQKAPLTPAYEKVHAESMADQALGGQGNFLDHGAKCFPGGMPFMMGSPVQEYIVTPETTYIVTGTEMRRIFTDGREWPTGIEPTYQGYSLGRWLDTDGDGVYDTLDVETRGPFKGPRVYDATGLPLAFDNQSIFRERFHLDAHDPNLLHDEITVIDHALTHPWSVDKTYKRSPNPHPTWGQTFCTEGNNQVVIADEPYWLSADGGLLMPTKKDQPPPDLRYFSRKRNTPAPAKAAAGQ